MKKIFLFLFSIILLSFTATAFDPKTTHPLFVVAMCEGKDGFNWVSNPYKDACCADLTHCIAGLQLPDIAIADYFDTSGGKGIGQKYKDTHSPLFCKLTLIEARTGQEKACAVGSCIHEIEDTVSHNILVPEAIRKSKLVNALIHAPTEIKFGDETINRYGKELGDKAVMYGTTSFDSVDDCFFMYERVLTSNYMKTYSSEKLRSRIDGFKLIFSSGTYKQVELGKGIHSMFSIAPWYISASVIIGFLGSFVFILYLLRKVLEKGLRKINIFFDFPLAITVFVICGVLTVGALTGSLYNVVVLLLGKMFFFIPVVSSNEVFDAVHQYNNEFFMLGALSPDEAWSPSGELNIIQADASVGGAMYWVLAFILLLFVIRFVVLFWRKK